MKPDIIKTFLNKESIIITRKGTKIEGVITEVDIEGNFIHININDNLMYLNSNVIESIYSASNS